MSNDERTLPVTSPPASEQDEPSCSPRIYVSNEEAALVAELRELREAALDIRRRLETTDPDDRAALESRLDELRTRRREVARRRDQAFTRKMIMLGHLPPNYPVER